MNVLIIKIGAIGDVIMALPLIEEIKKKKTNSKITWVVGEASYPIISRIANINVVKLNESSLLEKRPTYKIWEILKTWWKIGLNSSFDLIVNGHSDPRYKILAIPFLRKGNYKSFQKNHGSLSNLIPGRHHTNEYLRLFHGNDSLKSEEIIFPNLTYEKKWPAEKRAETTIALAPGGAKTNFKDDKLRRWPIENYVKLASKLIQKNYKVVIFGGPSDLWTNEYFNHLDIENLVSKSSLIDSIYELSSMHCMVTHDCGPMHFSILANVPVVSIFGPTNPWEKFPQKVKSSVIWGGKELPCRPCYDGKYYANCSSNICMKNVTSEQVSDEIMKILNNQY